MKAFHLGSEKRSVHMTAEVLTVRQPPELLWYAADETEAVRIRKKGLGRSLVRKNLYETAEAARMTGKPCLFRIRAGALCREGGLFYCGSDGVWSCPRIKREFIDERSSLWHKI